MTAHPFHVLAGHLRPGDVVHHDGRRDVLAAIDPLPPRPGAVRLTFADGSTLDTFGDVTVAID